MVDIQDYTYEHMYHAVRALYKMSGPYAFSLPNYGRNAERLYWLLRIIVNYTDDAGDVAELCSVLEAAPHHEDKGILVDWVRGYDAPDDVSSWFSPRMLRHVLAKLLDMSTAEHVRSKPRYFFDDYRMTVAYQVDKAIEVVKRELQDRSADTILSGR